MAKQRSTSWFSAGNKRTKHLPARPRYRLDLERLEDRLVPAFILTGVPTWNPIGPGPVTNAANVDLDGNGNPNGAPIRTGDAADLDTGAVEAIAVDPANASHVVVGTVNGGVWVTNNANAANPNWVTNTDFLPSLAIGAVAFQPGNTNLIFAGTGSYSSTFGSISTAGDGGAAVGVYRSADNGATWTLVGFNTFQGMRIQSIIPTTLNGGQTVFAATTDTNGANTGGIYRSNNSGLPNANGTDSWVRVSGANGLPNAPVSHLTADPGNANRFYAAVVTGAGVGIYRSTDGGVNWFLISNNLAANIGNSQRIELSVSAAGTNPVYAGLINNAGNLLGVFRSVQGTDGLDNDGANGVDDPAEATWVQVGAAAPPLYGNNNQGATHFSIAADPNAADVVYVGGDTKQPFPFSANLARGNATANTWTAIAAAGTNTAAGGTITTAPHADSRDMVFAGNNLLEADDGGIYQLTNPRELAGTASVWTSLNGNLQNSEFISIALDDRGNANTADDLIAGGLQDDGAIERATGGAWSEILGGDGLIVQANDAGSVRYYSTQNFSNFAQRTGGGGTVLPGRAINGAPAGTQLRQIANIDGDAALEGFDATLNGIFGVEYRLNAANPNQILLGSVQRLYLSTDSGATFTSIGGLVNGAADGVDNDNNGVVDDAPERIPGVVAGIAGRVQTIAFGSAANANAAYVGTRANEIYFTNNITVAGGGFAATGFNAAAGNQRPLDIVIDPNNANIAYAVTATGVFAYNGANWTPLTADFTDLALPGSPLNLRCIQLFNNNTATTNDDVLLVGGLGGVFKRFVTQPANVCRVWTEFSGTGVAGQTLPNVIVNDLEYDAGSDALLAGTAGRSAWIANTAAAAITAIPTLQVTGDGNANAMQLSQDANNTARMFVDDGTGTVRAFDLGTFTSVQFQGLGGADTVRIDSNGTTAGGTVAFVVFQISVDGGGNGGDTLILEDSGDASADRVTVTATTVGAAAASAGYLGDNLFGNCGQVTNYTGLSQLTINLGTSGDTVFVQATSTATTINGDGGSDTYRVSSDAPSNTPTTTGNLDGIAGALTIDAGAGGVNRLIVSDFGGGANPNVVVTSGQITGFAPAAINYAATGGAFTNGASNDGILLRGSDAGADVFNVRSTLGGSTTKIEGNGGDDVANVSSDAPTNNGDLDGIAGLLTIDAGAGGANRLVVSDFGGAGNPNVIVTTNRLQGLAPVDIVYSATGGDFTNGASNDGILLRGSDAGADVFNVRSTLGGSTTKIEGNGGDDVANVSSDAPTNNGDLDGIAGLLTIDAGAGGANRLIASDFGGGANTNVVVTNNQITGLAPVVITYSASGGAFTNGATNDGIRLRGADSGGDTFLVLSTLAGSTTTIEGNGGADTFRVGSTPADDNGDLDGVAGLLTVLGADPGVPAAPFPCATDPTGQVDVLYLNDRGDPNKRNYRIGDFTADGVDNPLVQDDNDPATPARAFAGVAYDSTMEYVRLDGTDEVNIFDIRPGLTTQYFIDGNLPPPGVCLLGGGDFLRLDTTGTTGRKLHITALGAGFWSFTSGHRPICFESIERFNHVDIFATAPDAGGSSTPVVKVYDAELGDLLFQIFPFKNAFKGGVRVATGDVNCDGLPDVLVAAGPGRDPVVKIYNGSPDADGNYPATPLGTLSFSPTTFRGGINLALGDVNADGANDLVVAADTGGAPTLRVLDGNFLFVDQRLIGAPLDVFPNTFHGGVNVAVGDINNDNYADIVVISGGGMATTVKVYSGNGFDLVKTFQPFGPSEGGGGASVAVGDFDGDGLRDIIIGSGQGSVGTVNVYSGTANFAVWPLTLITIFQPYGANYHGGIRLTVKPADGGNPGFVERVNILTAPGPGGGQTPRVIRQASFAGYGVDPLLVDKAFEDPDFNGIFIG